MILLLLFELCFQISFDIEDMFLSQYEEPRDDGGGSIKDEIEGVAKMQREPTWSGYRQEHFSDDEREIEEICGVTITVARKETDKNDTCMKSKAETELSSEGANADGEHIAYLRK